MDQLTQEKGLAHNSFRFDSLSSCVDRNGVEQHFNDSHQGRAHYTSNGCLECIPEFDSSYTYQYDALDRLVKVIAPEREIEFTYDAFHRCMERNVVQNGIKDVTKYLYAYFTEIGSTDEQNKILQLRHINFDKEYGEAVALELRNRVYIPVHDFQNNVVAIVDGESGKVEESYRFSAFGNESIFDVDGNELHTSINPWRYASKRMDSEVGLINFGKRYYSPLVGLWMTPDPQGFVDGMNLYVFLKNNPYRYADPTGEFVVALPLLYLGAEGITIAITTSMVAKTALVAAALWAGWEVGHYVNTTQTETQSQENEDKKRKLKTNNPFEDSVDDDIMVVDENGNVIPVKKGQSITASPDSKWMQVRDPEGNPTGLRKDGPHSSNTNQDPRAREPHAHVPNATNSDGTPWLPIKK